MAEGVIVKGFFYGHANRECGEHRTVGAHRAWCYDCQEWCYPSSDGSCRGCTTAAVSNTGVPTACPTCGQEVVKAETPDHPERPDSHSSDPPSPI
jgi:hypothetical protein